MTLGKRALLVIFPVILIVQLLSELPSLRQKRQQLGVCWWVLSIELTHLSIANPHNEVRVARS